MKKEQVLIGLGVATAMVTAFNGHAQADEVVNKHSTKSTVNQSETKKDADVSESDVKNAEIKQLRKKKMLRSLLIKCNKSMHLLSQIRTKLMML